MGGFYERWCERRKRALLAFRSFAFNAFWDEMTFMELMAVMIEYRGSKQEKKVVRYLQS